MYVRIVLSIVLFGFIKLSYATPIKGSFIESSPNRYMEYRVNCYSENKVNSGCLFDMINVTRKEGNCTISISKNAASKESDQYKHYYNNKDKTYTVYTQKDFPKPHKEIFFVVEKNSLSPYYKGETFKIPKSKSDKAKIKCESLEFM